MLFRITLSALAAAALAHGAALAQSPADGQDLLQKIHDKLVSDGFSDVHVVPQSFLISAKDKTGKPVVMLVGPNSATVLSAPQPGDENTAEGKDGGNKPTWQ